MKHILTSLFVFFLLLLQLQAQEESRILIQENYNGQAFLEFAETIEDEYNVQLYFFTGWVNDLKVNQKNTPSSVKDILTSTLKGTDFSFYLNEQRQIIISYGTEIKSKFNLLDSSELALEIEAQTEDYSESVQSLNSNNEFESNWIILGDPNSPEQKPEVRLSGYVNNLDNGEPLEGVLIYIEELKTGTSTDSSGFFDINVRQGRYQLTFQSIGLKDVVRKIQVYASGQLAVGMGELVMNIEEVVVRADRKDNVESVQIGVEALKISTIKELPALLGEVDIVRSALMLPGV